ncbi:MAG: nitroreductase family protein [Bacteroidetes bacterium]|nr:nitroreductase family protein [Bacteroidota bacterium]MBU1679296.1 nitroreductase family protein [Bacteroidota bacterium]
MNDSLKHQFQKFENFPKYSEEEMITKSEEFLKLMKSRRTIRSFSNKAIPEEVISNSVKTAATAPSGANFQPWHFIVVYNKNIKKKIRLAAEKEEREFYSDRAPEEWLQALAPLGTDANKLFLEEAPVLIVIFEEKFSTDSKAEKIKHYYTKESVGIATGILITALHNSGIATLTHTPSPMNFLNDILNRPKNEKPYLILVAGYPAKEAEIPVIEKKSFEVVATILK